MTSAHRPFEHGWEQDHSVYNKGVEKGWILSRNAAGFTAPNLDAEACLADVLRHTYPTLEIALLCSLTVGWIAIAVVILCVAGCCMGVFALGTETWDARKRARQQQNLNTPVGVKPFAPAGYTPEPYYATGAGRVGTL